MRRHCIAAMKRMHAVQFEVMLYLFFNFYFQRVRLFLRLFLLLFLLLFLRLFLLLDRMERGVCDEDDDDEDELLDANLLYVACELASELE